VIVVIESARAFYVSTHGDVGALGEVDVWPAVPIVVEQEDATAHCSTMYFFSGERREKADYSLRGDIFQLRTGRPLQNNS